MLYRLMDWTGLRGRTGANRKKFCRWGNFFFRPVKDIENNYALSNSFKHYAGGGQYFLNLFRCAGATTRGLDRFKHYEQKSDFFPALYLSKYLSNL